jgi:hypothetical protein
MTINPSRTMKTMYLLLTAMLSAAAGMAQDAPSPCGRSGTCIIGYGDYEGRTSAKTGIDTAAVIRQARAAAIADLAERTEALLRSFNEAVIRNYAKECMRSTFGGFGSTEIYNYEVKTAMCISWDEYKQHMAELIVNMK